MKNLIQDVEQYAKADLLAVMLFEGMGGVINQKGMPVGASGLAPPLYKLRFENADE